MKSRALLVVLVVIQLGVVALAIGRVRENPPVIGEAKNVELSGTVIASPSGTLESGLALARDRALNWDSSAQLMLVSEQIDWPFEMPPAGAGAMAPGGWLSYVFASDSGRALSIELERLTGNVQRAVETTWVDGKAGVGLPLAETLVSSEAAVIAVEETVGRTFRGQCPTVRNRTIVTLSLGGVLLPSSTPEAGGTPVSEASGTPMAGGGLPALRSGLVWLVTYADQGAGDTVALKASVDATTGEIIRIDNDLDRGTTPCGL